MGVLVEVVVVVVFVELEVVVEIETDDTEVMLLHVTGARSSTQPYSAHFPAKQRKKTLILKSKLYHSKQK